MPDPHGKTLLIVNLQAKGRLPKSINVKGPKAPDININATKSLGLKGKV